jgi:hypothetical protein
MVSCAGRLCLKPFARYSTAMRLPPHTRYLMALRGRKTLRGRTLPTQEEAVARLRCFTGQDFGLDAEQWGSWIKTNRRGLYREHAGNNPISPEDGRQGRAAP